MHARMHACRYDGLEWREILGRTVQGYVHHLDVRASVVPTLPPTWTDLVMWATLIGSEVRRHTSLSPPHASAARPTHTKEASSTHTGPHMHVHAQHAHASLLLHAIRRWTHPHRARRCPTRTRSRPWTTPPPPGARGDAVGQVARAAARGADGGAALPLALAHGPPPRRSMVKVAFLERPQLATTGSSGCVRRRAAALRTREERHGTSDHRRKRWLFSHTPTKLPFLLRLTIQAPRRMRSRGARGASRRHGAPSEASAREALHGQRACFGCQRAAPAAAMPPPLNLRIWPGNLLGLTDLCCHHSQDLALGLLDAIPDSKEALPLLTLVPTVGADPRLAPAQVEPSLTRRRP